MHSCKQINGVGLLKVIKFFSHASKYLKIQILFEMLKICDYFSASSLSGQSSFLQCEYRRKSLGKIFIDDLTIFSKL